MSAGGTRATSAARSAPRPRTWAALSLGSAARTAAGNAAPAAGPHLPPPRRRQCSAPWRPSPASHRPKQRLRQFLVRRVPPILRPSPTRCVPPPFTTVSPARPTLHRPERGFLHPSAGVRKEGPSLSPPLTMPFCPRDFRGVKPQPRNREISRKLALPAQGGRETRPPPPALVWAASWGKRGGGSRLAPAPVAPCGPRVVAAVTTCLLLFALRKSA